MTALPRMVEARLLVESPVLADPIGSLREELRAKGLADRIRPGRRIAITAGSRGIARIPEILAAVVEEVRAAGGEPFLVSSMGSHGGATAHGQVEVLRSLGITEERVGAPIVSSMDVEEVGRVDGVSVYLDRNALRADGILDVGRVKPHTDFKGTIESGLMKMLAIGLGKQKGAEMIHGYLRRGYHELMPAAARLILQKTNVVMGLAVVENAHHRVAKVKALLPDEIEREEPRLLEEAKALLARLPFRSLDVLIVEEMGKHISGVGMDTNVTGRFWIEGESEPRAPVVDKIVVLDLAPESHGNAIGIGLADLTTRRLVDKIDHEQTFVNCLTQGTCHTGKTPMWLPSDRAAIETALRMCGPLNGRPTRVVRIKNTLDLERIWVSEGLAEEFQKASVEPPALEWVGEPREMQFDVLGTLAR